MLHVSDLPKLYADILGCLGNIKRTELLVVKILDFFFNNVIKMCVVGLIDTSKCWPGVCDFFSFFNCEM